MHDYDVIVIGGGPAGLAAALAANENGARVLVVEREERLGGMLKQCIHDGFGLRRFGERLAGPEYVERFMDKIAQSDIEAACNTFVTRAEKPRAALPSPSCRVRGCAQSRPRALSLPPAAAREAQSRCLSTERARQECSLPAQRSISQTVSVSCRRKMCYPRFGRYRPYHGAQTYS